MDGIEHANGHRPDGLSFVLHPSVASAARPDPSTLPFDLETALESVLGLRAHAPEDALSSSYMGTERIGNGVVVGDDGLVLTIGYLVTEADDIRLFASGGRAIHADLLAYDFASGLALLRAAEPVGAAPLPLGSAAEIAEQDSVIAAAYGGTQQSIAAKLISKREFAGNWEYLLDEALFTTPVHPAWSGAALLSEAGRLVGIGSLFVQDAAPGGGKAAGNMFVPIDLYKAVADELLAHGRRLAPPRPWVGMYAAEAFGRVLVTSVSDDGPAEDAGLQPGDVILAVNGETVSSLGALYRTMWASGPAGASIQFRIQRDERVVEVSTRSIDRASRMKPRLSH